MAALIGDCSDHAVKKWRYGERLPRLEQMRRVFAVTDGAVTPNDFVLHPGARLDQVDAVNSALTNP